MKRKVGRPRRDPRAPATEQIVVRLTRDERASLRAVMKALGIEGEANAFRYGLSRIGGDDRAGRDGGGLMAARFGRNKARRARAEITGARTARAGG